MPTPPFDLFEEICNALNDQRETVLVERDFSPLLRVELQRWYGEPVVMAAVKKALDYLRKHFKRRGSRLPFRFDPRTNQYRAVDTDYISYISLASAIHGTGAESKEFELATAERLTTRLTGSIRRVGSPRDKRRKKSEFNKYLEGLGFKENVLGKGKGVGDAGFDVLWLPPLGAVPLRPIVSIQCKNSRFKRDDGHKSVGRAKQSMGSHRILSQVETYMCCVVYNDYIDESYVEKEKHIIFVPLGLNDLAPLRTKIDSEYL